jgi:SHS2 domain-containing protein
VEQGEAGYAIFAVTADQGIHAWAPELSELFRQAALGLWSLMVDRAGVRQARALAVGAEAGDRESLLVAWLNELLYLSETEHLVAADCGIASLTDTRLAATVWGETVDPARHTLRGHVKAATYHRLAIGRTPRGWEARVIVDV